MSQPYLGSPGAELKPTPSSFCKLAWTELLDAKGSFKSPYPLAQYNPSKQTLGPGTFAREYAKAQT